MTQRNDRSLDIAIRVITVVVIVLSAYLTYMLWDNSRVQAVSSPSGRAVENLRAAVKAAPGNPMVRVRLAEALVFAGRMPEAVEQYNAALELKKDYVPALSGLANLAMQDKQYATAVSYWTKIIKMLEGTSSSRSPDLEGAYYGLGVTYLEMKKYEEAVLNLKESLRMKSSASDTHYMLSVAYRELGYPDKQREELNITLAFEPKNAQANYDAGMLALKEGDVATAAESFRTATNWAPAGIDLPRKELDKIAAKGSASVRLANALASKESTTALSEARISAALDPTNVTPVRIVARLWEEFGEKTRALNAYERIVELVPGDAQATQAIKRLRPDGK
ncbi:MAG: tetratricopeptide repeat protein [Coriobacteriia bacterium]|nr:tetratricopeptide repeat protein [Coriobacteriia bacterium]